MDREHKARVALFNDVKDLLEDHSGPDYQKRTRQTFINLGIPEEAFKTGITGNLFSGIGGLLGFLVSNKIPIQDAAQWVLDSRWPSGASAISDLDRGFLERHLEFSKAELANLTRSDGDPDAILDHLVTVLVTTMQSMSR